MKSYTEIPAWFFHRPLYTDITNNYMKDGMKIVAIGIWKGGDTIFLAQKAKEKGFKNTKIYAIDSWAEKHGLQDVYPEFLKNVKDCEVDDIITTIRDFSHNVVSQFENNSLDFIHIDGEHSYEGVSADIKDYWPKLKIGGIMAGDDYCAQWSGVMKAADEAFGNLLNKDYVTDEPDHHRFPPGKCWSWCIQKNSEKDYLL